MAIPQALSVGEETFLLHCRAHGLDPQREVELIPDRKFRFDFYFPEKDIAVEIEGGTWIQGRHSRGPGYQRDLAKYNAAALMGILVFRFTTGMVVSGEAIDTIRAALTSPAPAS